VPVYQYRCGKGHEFEQWRSIHAPSVRQLDCDCGMVGRLVLQAPAIFAAALPTKAGMAEVRSINEREDRLARDLDAYKRIRRQGIQPKGIDGCAELEATVNTRTEVEMGRRLPKHAAWVGSNIASDMLGKDVGELRRGKFGE
jgi:hypothetical protein